MLDRKKERLVVFALFLFSFAIRLLILLHSDDTNGLGGVLPAILQRWWSISEVLQCPHLPLGIYSIKAAYFIFGRLPIVTRIPSFLCGSLLVVPFYYLIRTLYDSEVAFFSGLMLAVFYEHITMSVTSSIETSFYFFIFSALYFLFRFNQEDNKKTGTLILSAIALNFAAMSRYEAWFLIPLMNLFLIKQRKRYIFTFFSISLIFPIIWMFLNFKFLGNPFAFHLNQIKSITPEYLAGLGLGTHMNLVGKLSGWFLMLKEILSPLLLWVGLFGLSWSILKKRFALPLLFFCVYSGLTFKVVTHMLFLGHRNAIILALFFIVFIIYGISIIPKVKRLALCVFILFLSAVWVRQAINTRPLFPLAHVAMLEYLKTNLRGDEQIAVSGINYEMLVKDICLRYPSVRIDQIVGRYTKGEKWGQIQFDHEWFQKYAQFGKPKYIVLDNLDSIILLPDIKEVLGFFPNAKAECVFSYNNSGIYKMTYEPA